MYNVTIVETKNNCENQSATFYIMNELFTKLEIVPYYLCVYKMYIIFMA